MGVKPKEEGLVPPPYRLHGHQQRLANPLSLLRNPWWLTTDCMKWADFHSRLQEEIIQGMRQRRADREAQGVKR